MNIDVFISHASTDRQFAESLYKHLEQHGFRCWIARDKLTGGEAWPPTVHNAVKSARLFVVVLSSRSCRSKHVLREVSLADSFDKIIIPIYSKKCSLGNLNYHLAATQAILGKSAEAARKQLVAVARAALEKSKKDSSVRQRRTVQVDDNANVELARLVCGKIRKQLEALATSDDALTISEPVLGRDVKFIDLVCNKAARKALSEWAAKYFAVYLMGEDIDEVFPPNTELSSVCVLDSLDGTHHWLRGKNLYCTALSIFQRTAGANAPLELRVSAIQQSDGNLLIAREDMGASFIYEREQPVRLRPRRVEERMANAHVCTVSRRPAQYRALVHHLASGSPFAGLYTFGGNPALADLALGRYDAVFQTDASSVGDRQPPIWDWLPGGHILSRCGASIIEPGGSNIDVKAAAERLINAGDGHYPYVASFSRSLALKIAKWLSSGPRALVCRRTSKK